ncbi:MAG TPA: hypothetical protein VGD98_13230 [Ktedonobacteraceae bacterium]
MDNDNTQRHHLPIHITGNKLLEPADLATIFNEVATARLVLRRPQPGDNMAMCAVHGDPATNLYNPADPDPDLATSEETLRDWIQR